jgi:hypothetical protein
MTHVPEFEIDRSREFFFGHHPEAYEGFDVIDGMTASICMDTRPAQLPSDERHLTSMMGPGGEIGEATDHSLGLTVIKDRLVTPEEALGPDMDLRRATLHSAHYDCWYSGNFSLINEEVANPSDETRSAVQRWSDLGELGRMATDTALEDVQGAAGLLVAELETRDTETMDHMIPTINAAHPGRHNVTHMEGTPTPKFYIVSHWPNVGLNRHVKHKVERIQGQAYFDSLTPRVNNIRNTYELGHNLRALRVSALLLRSAATRTVVNAAKTAAGAPLENWEIEMGRNGLHPVRIS